MNLNPENRKRKRTSDEIVMFLSDDNVLDDTESNEQSNDFNNNNSHDPNDGHESATRTGQQNLLMILKHQIHQFESECFTGCIIHTPSQQQITSQRNRTSKILICMQKLLLQSTISCTQESLDETATILSDEIQNALNILIEQWDRGDIQIYNTFIETLLRSCSAVVSSFSSSNTIPHAWEIRVQQFILLELLPRATGSYTEKCHYAQSIIAKALLQILSLCSSATVIESITRWCRWYIDFYHSQQPKSLLNNMNASTTTTTPSFMISPEIHQLGLELLRNVPSIDLLPRVTSIVLDLFSIMVTSNTMNYAILEQNANIIMTNFRQQLMEFVTPQQQQNLEPLDPDCIDTVREEQHILERQLQITHLFVTSILEEDTNQGLLLTNAYLQQLQLTMMVHTVTTTSKGSHELQNRNDQGCDSLHMNVLSIDWIFVMMVMSSSSSSSRHQSTISSILNFWCNNEMDCASNLWLGISQTLSTVIDIVFLDDPLSSVDKRPPSSGVAIQVSNTLLKSIKYRHTQQRLIPLMLQLTVVLLLCPRRRYFSYHTTFGGRSTDIDFTRLGCEGEITIPSRPWVHRFVLNLYRRLDCDHQKELVRMLLHLVDGCSNCARASDIAPHIISPIVKSQNEGADSFVVQSVFTILERIVDENPRSILCFKKALMERLTGSTSVDAGPTNEYVDRHICNLLISLMTKFTNKRDDNPTTGAEDMHSLSRSEMLFLVQKLMFGESLRNDTTRPARGIVLATELLFTKIDSTISEDDRNCILEWVLRCLLPSTRRMVEPELGLAGLSFLKVWIDWNESNNRSGANSFVFQHFKMILANTGLIQSLDKFQAVNEKDSTSVSESFLGYYALTSKSHVNHESSTKAMVFGVNFFLRHSSIVATNPLHWSQATDWVYALVDTYLQMGRTKAGKSWHPNNWLRAAVEFPKINTAFFKNSVEAQHLVVDWMNKFLCNFDLSYCVQHSQFFPPTYADTVIRCLSSKKLRLFIESLKFFALALIVGISLSAAVLKNAADRAWSTENSLSDYHELIKYQINKIYDLRTKSTTMDSLFSSIEAALRRSLLRKKRTAVVLSDDSSDGSNTAVTVSTGRTFQVRRDVT
jgi:hypothetical protein